MTAQTDRKQIRVKRMNGELAVVDVIDAQHYEVDLEGPDPESPDEPMWRHELVVAPTATAAKRLAKGICVKGEKPVSARKLTLGEVAVFVLNGAQVVR